MSLIFGSRLSLYTVTAKIGEGHADRESRPGHYQDWCV